MKKKIRTASLQQNLLILIKKECSVTEDTQFDNWSYLQTLIDK